jgi:hypothetical protein
MMLARSLVNHYWRHFFGRGLVEPEGDLRTSVDATMPDVLDSLAKELIDHRFEARHLVRAICTSQLYQSTAAAPQPKTPPPIEPADYFASFRRQRLGMPMLATAIDQITESPGIYADKMLGGGKEGPLWYRLDRGYSTTISRPARQSCPCDEPETPRSVLMLMGSDQTTAAITHPRGRLARLLHAGYSDERIVEELYLAALARRPKREEREMIAKHLATTTSAKGTTLFAARWQCYEDIIWALINTNEFLFVN